MENELKFKTFLKAIKEIHLAPDKIKSYLSDKRLTQSEKKILQSWDLIRKGKYNEVFSILTDNTGKEHSLVFAQKLLIEGISLNQAGHFGQAIDKLTMATKIHKQHDLPNYTFTCHYNLFIAASNNHDIKSMKDSIKFMQNIRDAHLLKEHQELAVLECHFIFHTIVENRDLAESAMNELESKKELMSSANYNSFLINKFIFLVKNNNFLKAKMVLQKLKSQRSFRVSANYLYMKIMLNYLLNDTPIYAYDYQFKQHQLLFNQVKVVQALCEGEENESKKYWLLLQKTNNSIYKEGFSYEGETNLFSLCLNKALSKKLTIVPNISSKTKMSKTKKLMAILKELNTPIHKDKLFELVWERPPESKLDLQKLAALISKIKRRHEFEVSYNKNRYFYNSAKSKAS